MRIDNSTASAAKSRTTTRLSLTDWPESDHDPITRRSVDIFGGEPLGRQTAAPIVGTVTARYLPFEDGPFRLRMGLRPLDVATWIDVDDH